MKRDPLDFVSKFIIQCREEEDRFIFEQLKPYSEHITKMEVNKRELETALLKSKPAMVMVFPDRDNFPDHFGCPRCSRIFKLFEEHPRYCPDCGQALSFTMEGES